MYYEIAVGAYILGNYVYHRWIEDHPKPIPGEVISPSVTVGDAVPLVYGRCRVRAPVLEWSGSQRQFLVATSNSNAPRAFAYFLDMLYIVGIPFNGGVGTLKRVFAGDFALSLNLGSTWPFTTVDSNGGIQQIPVYGPTTSTDRENYWVDNQPARVFHNDLEIMVNYGFIEFFKGTPLQVISNQDQTVNPRTDTEAVLRADAMNHIYEYLNDDLSDTVHYTPDLDLNIASNLIPSYRNQMTCCMYHWCNGDSTQLNSYSFETETTSSGSPSDFGVPDLPTGDANPAEVLHDLLTSPWGKLGLPTSKLDSASFAAAALTLYNEGHGYSRSIEKAEDAPAIIAAILKQIDAVMYEEPTTGMLVLKLIRSDYGDPSLLTDINPDNAVPARSGWYSVQGWSEILNEVRLTFTDRANNYGEGLAVGQNAAAIIVQGGRVRSVDIQYEGCCTRDQAQRLTSRELVVVSQPQTKISVRVGREFYLSRPGDVFTFTWPKLGIDRMVVRVARIDLGTLHDGTIELGLIREVFGVDQGAFAPAS